MLNKHKLKRCFTKQIGFRYSDSCSKKNVCYYSYPMLHIIPDLNTNVTHFTKHMNRMTQAMDTPEDSTASLWTLTSSPRWKIILITIILIVLFLLFSPCICNCVAGFVSSCMKAFKLQMVAPTPVTAAASSSYYLGPLDQRPSI